MASHSPTRNDDALDERERYLRGWAALTELMRGGNSWSGHERNNCYVNLGDGRFADVSAISGLDFADDGRAVAATDWDGDGDLDLWLKNRTGPQLRFMANERGSREPWIAFLLEGTRANRDAIGARVEVHTGSGAVLRRSVVAGDGYLSQSSRRLHVGLSGRGKVERVVVQWPGGAREELGSLAAGRRYTVKQGERRAVASAPRAPVAIEGPAAGTTEPAAASRVLLKEPLPLPPGLRAALAGPPGRPTLVALWAHWCEPCYAELGSLARALPQLGAAGVAPVAVSVDPEEEQALAERLFAERVAPAAGSSFASRGVDAAELATLEALLRHLLDRPEPMVLPTSLLVDASGALQMIYLGPVTPARVIEDARTWASEQALPAHRRGLGGGRWYFRTPRPFGRLAGQLRELGQAGEASFYENLAAREAAASAPPM